MIRDNGLILLHEWYDANKANGFQWGKFDCCLGFLTGLIALNDNPRLREAYQLYQGQYKSAKGAINCHQKINGTRVKLASQIAIDILDSILPRGEMGVYRRGDPIIMEYQGKTIGGMIALAPGYIWVISDNQGIIHVPCPQCKIRNHWNSHA